MVLLNAAINAILNLLSASVAFLVSYYAYSTNRLVGNNLLRYISAGFLLLGVGLFAESLTQGLLGLTPVDIVRFHGLELLGFVIFIVLQVIAYGVFAWGYALSAFGRQRQAESAAVTVAAAALPASALEKTLLELFIWSSDIFLVAQLVIVLLMVFVVVQGLFVYSRNKNPLALTVFFGFVLIFIAHVALFTSVVVLSEPLYLAGTFVQFLGFLSLLFFLYRSGRIGSV